MKTKEAHGMKNIKNVKKLVLLSMTIMVIVVTAVIVLFQVNLYRIDKKVSEYTSQYLKDIMYESAESIKAGIQRNFTVMEVMAALTAGYNDMYNDDVAEMLEEESKKMGAVDYNVISRNGTGIAGKAVIDNVLEQECVKRAFQGENTVSDIVTVGDKQEIVFNVPIYQKGQIKAVLQFGYDLGKFAELVKDTALSRKADTFITQKDGTLVSRPESVKGGSNLFALLQGLVEDENDAIKKLQKEIENGDTGALTIGKEKYKRYICYNHISENGWYVVTIMSAKVVENNIYDVSERAESIGQGVILIFVLLIGYIFFVFVWLYTNTKMNTKRYQIVAEQSSNIIFEYYYETGEAYHTDKWYEKLGYPPVEKNYIENMTKGDIVVPEDKEVFESVFEELRHGTELVEKRVRIYDKNQNPIWFSIKASVIKNRKGKISKVIGRYIDIDNRVRTLAYLKGQAETDRSTGLLNKETTNFHITQILNQLNYPDSCAIYFIDIDDFTNTNAAYGREFGDNMVETLAKVMKATGPENVIAGRFGGDEFVMVLPKIKDVKEAEQFAEKLLQNTAQVEFAEHPEVKLQICIGIAIAPRHGRNVNQLLQDAEQAMHLAKEKKGKNSYRILS